MCDGFSEAFAIAGAVAAVAGSAVSYTSSQNAASAAANAQAQQRQAQAAAFQQRNQAQQLETQQQAAVQDASQRRYQEVSDQMRTAEDSAQTDRAKTIDKLNVEAQSVRDQVDQNVQQTTQKTITPASMDQAQAASEAARTAGTAPTIQDIAASSPMGQGANAPTKSAIADRMAQAAEYTKGYSERLAKLGSYSAPVTETGLATQQLGMNLMPAALADKLLTSGTAARLLPSQLAYSNAADYGKAAIAANTAATGEQMAMTTNRAQSAVDLANLGQADTNANIQTGLNVAQARAAAMNSIGQGATAIGNAGIQYGASKGAFADLFGGSGVTGAEAAAAKSYQAGAFSAAPAGSFGPFA
jgi:hypothetical protein